MRKNGRYSLRKLSTIIASFEAGVSVLADDRAAVGGEHGVLKVSAVGEGRFFPNENKVIRPSEIRRMGPCLRKGDVLVSRANTLDLVGVAARVEVGSDHLHLSDKTWRACLEDDEGTRRWLVHVLNSSTVRFALRMRATGTSGSMKNISQAAYLGIEVPTPATAKERGRIALVLDDFATAAQQVADLADAKRRFKRTLTRRLFAGVIGDHHGSRANVNPRQLSELLRESREMASSGTYARKVTVRLYGRGVVPKNNGRFGSANTQYFRRRAGQLIYSKLDFLNGAFGIVPDDLDGFESTLDLPAFDITPGVNPRWLLHLLVWPGFYKKQIRLANGGRKARRVNPAEFLKIVIGVPPRSEQDAVAGVLDAVDRELAILERLADAMARQKRALQDKLLSGELRLPAR